MAKLIIVSIVLSLVLAINSVKIPENNLNANVVVVDNLDEYLKENPNVKLLEQLTREDGPSPATAFTYRLGNRVSGE